jgi:Zn-dependent M16 (insulinase) family peptidase
MAEILPNTRPRKIGVVELAKRVAEVQNLLINGATRQQIIQHITQKYGILSRQAENYITKANRSFAVDFEEERRTIRAKAGRRLEKLYALAAAEKDRQEMLRVLDRIIRFYGLDEPVRTVNLNANFNVSELSDEQLDKLLNERRAQLEQVAPELADQYAEYINVEEGDEDIDSGADGEGFAGEAEGDMGEEPDPLL